MDWMKDPRFKIAHEMAALVIEKMEYKGGAVDINQVMRVVEKERNVDVKIGKDYFSKIEGTNGRLTKFGAAMSVVAPPGEEAQARILLNLDWPPKRRRFSLAHELGHLITEQYTVADANNQFSASTHINADITSISEEELAEDDTLVNEQVANIFALLVLMPEQAFVTAMELLKSKGLVADYFGVETSAVESRSRLV